MKRIIALIALAVVPLAVAGASCLPKPLTPEQRECMVTAKANKPDLTGTWETSDQGLVDIRHSPSNQMGINVAISAGSPKPPAWVPEAASLRDQACGTEWSLAIDRSYPGRKAEPGQFISQLDHDLARLSPEHDRLTFPSGEVWTRVGAVGELAVPKPGVPTSDIALTGDTLQIIPDVRNTNDCFAKCEANERCAAAVHHEQTCTLQSNLGPPRETALSSAFINPKYDPRPPPTVPLAGARAANLQLTGALLRQFAIGTIPNQFPNAERDCAVACDGEWSCAGYSANTEGTECQLLAQVTGAKRVAKWASRVQPAKMAEVPRPGKWTYST